MFIYHLYLFINVQLFNLCQLCSLPPLSVPPPPNNVRVTPSSDYIRLDWTAPNSDIKNFSVTGYRIKLSESKDKVDEGIKPQEIELASIDNFYTLSDLTPSTFYRIRIQPITNFGDGRFSEPILTKTLEEFSMYYFL